VSPPAAAAPKTPAGDDTSAIVATPGELDALGAALTVPVSGVRAADLLDTFNETRDGGTRRHEALDIPAPRGTPVLSATAGRLLKKFDSKTGGLMVYAADASERFVLLYGHLDRYADGLVEGQPLARGQVIGYVGTTGNAPPNLPHLHFGIARARNVAKWYTGTPIDPRPLLQGRAPTR
jgi:murein DD-endopeptidase MepM/ murein hydrolase activator NlpD